MLDFAEEAALRREPRKAFVLGAFSASVGIVFAYLIFREAASFPAVFLASIVAAPPIVKLLEVEGLGKARNNIWERHENLVSLYAYVFFGMSAAFAVWYAGLPPSLVQTVFGAQLKHVAIGAFIFSIPLFLSIVSNNLGLVLSFFLLSFFRGYGSIFLLGWNASVLGLVWGNAIKSIFTSVTLKHIVFIWSYLIPEVLAYFFAAISGGLLFFNIKKRTKRVDRDAYIFLAAAAALIIMAGIIETLVLGIV